MIIAVITYTVCWTCSWAYLYVQMWCMWSGVHWSCLLVAEWF